MKDETDKIAEVQRMSEDELDQIAKRESYREVAIAEMGRRAQLRIDQRLKDQPQQSFDPRTELSKDAKHIVKHMWIILVLLPVVLGIALAIIKAL